MKIVIPISSVDQHLLEDQLSLLEHFGGLESYPVVFSPSGATEFAAESAADRLRPLCYSASVLDVGYQELGTWPQGPNSHWARTVYALGATGNTDIWFWMELDCKPRVKNWARKIQAAHGEGGKMFCGKIVPTPHRDQAGNIVREKNDDMMMGCGVYPANMQTGKDFSHIAKGLIDGTMSEPFDKHMRWWMHGFGWANTNLIGDRWNTGNYRMEDGKMVCDALPSIFKSRDHSKTDISEAVVVHGVKDDTFTKLVLSAEYDGEQAKAATATVSMAATSPVMAAPNQEIEALKRMVLDLSAQIASLKSSPPPNGSQGEPASAPSAPSSEVGGLPGIVAHETKGGGEFPIKEVIKKALSQKSVKLSDMRVIYGIADSKKKEFEDYVLGLGFSLYGYAKWIKDDKAA